MKHWQKKLGRKKANFCIVRYRTRRETLLAGDLKRHLALVWGRSDAQVRGGDLTPDSPERRQPLHTYTGVLN
jgi:hypothetical protein